MSVGGLKHGWDATRACKYFAKEVKILYRSGKTVAFLLFCLRKIVFLLQNETKCGTFVAFDFAVPGQDRMWFGKVLPNLVFHSPSVVFGLTTSARGAAIFKQKQDFVCCYSRFSLSSR